jgi:anti-sigma factor RsiW
MNCKDIAELAPLYLSAEIEDGRRDLFQAHLAECRSCAGQLASQATLDARLRDAFSSDLPDAAALNQSVGSRIARERSRRWALVAASAAVLLFAAGLAYRSLMPAPLFSDAARDHRMEVMDRQPRRWRTDPAEIDKLAARYGLSNLAAAAPAGYSLEHAKICGIDGKPALHLVYTNGVQEFSVYVRIGAGSARSHRAVSVGSEHLASFQTGRLEAVIVTAGSSAECQQFARLAAEMLSS